MKVELETDGKCGKEGCGEPMLAVVILFSSTGRKRYSTAGCLRHYKAMLKSMTRR